MSNALKRIIAARTSLLLSQPFYGHLSLRLDLVESAAIAQGTMATNGDYLFFDPQFVNQISFDELKGVVCHEILHVALGHVTRMGDRELARWNQAADYIVNPIVIESGFKLPKDALINKGYEGKSVEWVYPKIPPSPPGQSGNGQLGCGGIVKPKSVDKERIDTEWQQAVVSAAKAAESSQGIGTLPMFVQHLVEQIRNPAVDWKAYLRRWIQTNATEDYSWTRPNRKYIPQGLYMPSLRSESMPPVVFCWDTSGSRDYVEARAECAAECAEVITECLPEKTYVMYGDTKVHRIDEFERGDTPEFFPVGGGGTDFRDFFKQVEKLDIQPACMIVMTDGEGTYPKESPTYPVLWAITTRYTAPFGDTIRIYAKDH